MSKWMVVSSSYSGENLYHYFPIGALVYEADNQWHLVDETVKMIPSQKGVSLKARSQTLMPHHVVELPDDYTQEDIDAAIVANLLKQ